MPLATHTGWNLYRAPYPEGELCDRFGTYTPFAARPPPSANGARSAPLAARSATAITQATLAQFQRAAQALVAERLLLAGGR